MRPSSHRPRPVTPPGLRPGFALEATILVMVLVAVLVGLSLTWVLTATRTGGLDYRQSRVAYAAEAGADAIMAQLESAMEDGLLRPAEIDALTTPTLSGFTFENMRVLRDSTGVSARAINSGTYKGLFALNQPIDIRIGARDAAANRAEVEVRVNAQSIPLFQFGVFYEEDLEIHNGPPMTFAGWVHTNSNLYLSSASSSFESRITTPDSVFWRRKNTTERLSGVQIDDEGGSAVPLRFDSRDVVDPAAFRLRSAADFDGRLMTFAHGVTPLRLPLPPGYPPITLIRPRAAGDDAQVQSVKYAWKADWHVVVDVAALGPNVCQNLLANSQRRAGLVQPSLADCKAIFQGHEDRFHEGREAVMVDVLDIDVDELRKWVQPARASRETQILYVTFRGASAGDYPAVRLVDARRLPNPFTVATDHPLYVRGDFNTQGWHPASLLGDAVTFLSGAWDDTKQDTFRKRDADAGGMSVFAAIAAGHSATPCDAFRGCGAPPYGGGLENFPRFLENWTGKTMTYRGSLVSLFQSEKAALRRWQWRGYYDAPNRDWQFELRFQDPNNLPPGTPSVGSVFQTAYRPVF